MLIRLKKVRDGVVLSCIRDGGAAVQRTGHGGYFALHDLMHYAAETVLGCGRAFFGLLAAGWTFGNFTRRDDPEYRPLPDEAIMVEHLVGSLSRHERDAAGLDEESLAILTDDVNADVAASMKGTGIPPPVLTAAQVRAIYERFEELAGRWSRLEIGAHLELRFPPS